MTRAHRILLAFYFLCLTAFYTSDALARFVKGGAKFYITTGDSLTVIKKQLIYLAAKDMISKELKRTGFNEGVFWQAYQESLDKKIGVLEENLNKQMLSAKKHLLEEYKKDWRQKRLKVEREHGNLLHVLDSYRVGRAIRSPYNPKVYTIKMEGKISRSRLNNLYFQFFSGHLKARDIDKVYWTLNLNLSRGSLDDFGVEGKDDIIEILNKILIDEFDKVLGHSKKEIVITDILDFEQIQNHLKNLDLNLWERASSKGRENKFSNAVWVHLKLDMAIFWDVFELERKGLDSHGDIVVTELRYNKPIYAGKLDQKREIIRGVRTLKFTEKIAHIIYQRIAPELLSLRKHLVGLPDHLERGVVNVFNYRNYIHLKDIQNFLMNAGEKYRMKVFLKSFNQGRARLILEHQSSAGHWGEILSRINGQKLRDGSAIVLGRGEDSWNITVGLPPETKEKESE